MKYLIASLLLIMGMQSSIANQESQNEEYLIELTKEAQLNGSSILMSLSAEGTTAEEMPLPGWYKITAPKMDTQVLEGFKNHPDVAHIQKNYILSLDNTFSFNKLRKEFLQTLDDNPFPFPLPGGGSGGKQADNPNIPGKTSPVTGSNDPLIEKQWGMKDIGVKEAWSSANNKGSESLVVAVIDTGVDYTHEDLVDNLWRNPKEIPDNNKDDDGNGFVDDIVGWDFVSNDNKPYDLSSDPFQMIIGGGNPGHGTHCAGNVAARSDNGKGVVGVAPNVKIMVLRFLSEKGQGTTADAIKSIKYAVDNGARVLSNSWGSTGEDPNEAEENKALRDMIQYSMDKGTLFVAAAGNGDQTGKGYDNDSSKQPAFPASYDHENIVSVAALDVSNQLGTFSNWGSRTVDIGAPGVKVFSTTVNGKYSDTVIDLPGLITATWDGTSMATPHVAGAAALYWSKYPNKTWKEVKEALINSASKIPSLSGKAVSGGKLNVKALMAL